MGKITKELVDDYAKKLLIGLTKEENDLVLKEFDIITEQMELIANIPGIEKIEPMTHALDRYLDDLDDDYVEEAIEINEALSNCQSYVDREVKVPKVVENNG